MPLEILHRAAPYRNVPFAFALGRTGRVAANPGREQKR